MIETDELRTLVPHSGKMLLLSRVLDYNVEGNLHPTLQSEFDVTENCIFYDKDLNGVPTWVGFELIAQSISALSGIRDRYFGIKPKLGFLLSVPTLKVNIPVCKNGSTARICIKQIDHTDMIFTFEGEIYLKDELAMEGKIMVIEINDNDERFAEFIKKMNIEV